MRDPSHHNRKRLQTVVGLLLAGALLVPAAAIAGHRFTDVPDSNVFHDDITAIADAGVTLGCNPPANDEYCPSEFVTREQMAAFLNRLGALSDDKSPVVNADKVDGWDAESFVFAPEPVALLERSMDFALTGGSPAECVETSSLTFEPDFAVVHQLHATPEGIDPWDVNVQLDTRNKAEGVYDVCFRTLDGSDLPAGTYETFGLMTLR